MDDSEKAEALRREHARIAHIPVVVHGDDAPAASKIGGTPSMSRGQSWPVCGTCEQPLRFVLQLSADDVPDDAQWALAGDVLQLFVCDSVGKDGDPEWGCQANDGGRPFAKSNVVLHVLVGESKSLEAALPKALLELRARRQLEATIAYCRRTGDEETAALIEARIAAAEPVADPHRYDVPATLEEMLVKKAFLFPVHRITAWRDVEDVPASGNLELDSVDLLRDRLGLECLGGDKLGGHPRWIHDSRVPRCRACEAPMRHLFQVVTNGLSPITLGGDGTGWIFVCPSCHDATFTWQR